MRLHGIHGIRVLVLVHGILIQIKILIQSPTYYSIMYSSVSASLIYVIQPNLNLWSVVCVSGYTEVYQDIRIIKIH